MILSTKTLYVLKGLSARGSTLTPVLPGAPPLHLVRPCLALAAAALLPAAGPAQEASGPAFAGDPDARERLAGPLAAAAAATAAFAPLPPGPWKVRLHLDDPAFERATGAPPVSAAPALR